MASLASVIAAAEQRAAQSRGNLHAGLRRLRFSVSRPHALAAAALLGALLARLPKAGRATDALATTLATAQVRRFAKRLFRLYA
jgi:hypothetical protein